MVVFGVRVIKPALGLRGVTPLSVKVTDPTLGKWCDREWSGPCILDILFKKIELRDYGEALFLNTTHGV